jgi:hypothetical protein
MRKNIKSPILSSAPSREHRIVPDVLCVGTVRVIHHWGIGPIGFGIAAFGWKA